MSHQQFISHPLAVRTACQLQMLVNVCNESLGCSLSSLSVHADGYPPDNLHSKTSHVRQKGFRVEHFVTPPVMLEVHLPHRVPVSNILVKVDLKPSETACLELLLPSSSGAGSCSSAHNGSVQWQPCCSCVIQGQIGANFRSKPLLAAMKTLPLKCMQSRFSDTSSIAQVFKVAVVGSPVLASTDTVAIRVKYMKTHRPVHISLVEVWAFFEKGPPPWLMALSSVEQQDCSAGTQGSDAVEEEGCSAGTQGSDAVEEQDCSARTQGSDAVEEQGCGVKKQDSDANRGENELSCVCEALKVVKKPAVKEKFLDALTQEVMVLPMLLPSGQRVDRSTIDRHNSEELKWGRPPSDPFTGVPYANTQQPVFDFKLKMELDHCHTELPQRRQTVGSADSIRARLPTKRSDEGDMPPSKRREGLEHKR